jgi:CDP-glucose 4,6-dehydratase
MLTEAGHKVSGLSLNPDPGSLFERAGLNKRMTSDFRADIRDPNTIRAAMQETKPDVVMHLAAQPLVIDSYRAPRTTIETNVIGTLNVLEAVSLMSSVRAQLIVTTDKVYRNVNRIGGYVEPDPLGGDDPYSASKAMADLLVHSWSSSFPGAPTAVARAGNVIGGGDISKDRLLPDLLRAFASGTPAVIRYPDAVRPWQHVLDCLHGYLLLVDALLNGQGSGSWNFGPNDEGLASVAQVSEMTAEYWGSPVDVQIDPASQLHEAARLTLDSQKARSELGWRDVLTLDEAIRWTVDWQKSSGTDDSCLQSTLSQIREYRSLSSFC